MLVILKMKAGMLETKKRQGLSRTEGRRDYRRRGTETFFQLTSLMPAIGGPGTETLQE